MNHIQDYYNKIKENMPFNNPFALILMGVLTLMRMSYSRSGSKHLMEMHGTYATGDHLASMEFATQWDLVYNLFLDNFMDISVDKWVVYQDGACSYVIVRFQHDNHMIEVDLNLAGKYHYRMKLPRHSSELMELTTSKGLTFEDQDDQGALPAFIGHAEMFFTRHGDLIKKRSQEV